MFTLLDIQSSADLEKLTEHLSDEFNPSEVISRLSTSLSPDVRHILVESNYVDKDYRSTYYSFYSKKGMRYGTFCVRLHFFKTGVSLTDRYDLSSAIEPLSFRYVGYMVIRPTPIAPIGRTVISVHGKNDFHGAVIDASHHVHVLGHRLEVKGFPYMQQHTDISVCAHAACWSILRHYTQRHRKYAEFLVDDVTQMASVTKTGGLIPSRGLSIEQACRIFAQAGLFPDVYSPLEGVLQRQVFYRALHAYVESGFPVFAALEEQGHAITVVGHGEPVPDAFVDYNDAVLFSWYEINSLVVIDDNHMPYLAIDCLDRGAYKVSDIDAFVAPLPEKIYLPYEAVEHQVVGILKNGFDGLDFLFLKDRQAVVRCFITTAPTLRAYLREQQSAYPLEFFTTLMDLTLPQFVWLAQISTLDEWKQKRVEMTFILDATASAAEEVPFFVVHDKSRAFVFDRGDSGIYGWLSFETELNPTSPFTRNLTYRH